MSCDRELSLSIHHFYFLWPFFYLGEKQFCCKAALGFHPFQWCFWITARASCHLPEQWFFPCMLYCLYWGNLWSQSLRCRWEWETSCPCSNLRLNLDWLEGTHTQRNQTWPRIWFFPADMITHAQMRRTSQPTFWPNLYRLSCQIDSKHAEEQFWHLWFSSSNGRQKKPWKASQRARVFFIHESPSPLKIVLGTCKTKKIEAFAAGHLLTSPSFPHLLPNWPLTPPQQKTGCMLPPSDALTRLTALASFCSVFCTCNWVTQSRARHLCQEDAQLYKKFYLTKVSI